MVLNILFIVVIILLSFITILMNSFFGVNKNITIKLYKKYIISNTLVNYKIYKPLYPQFLYLHLHNYILHMNIFIKTYFI